jgi:hypothetical protein
MQHKTQPRVLQNATPPALLPPKSQSLAHNTKARLSCEMQHFAVYSNAFAMPPASREENLAGNAGTPGANPLCLQPPSFSQQLLARRLTIDEIFALLSRFIHSKLVH